LNREEWLSRALEVIASEPHGKLRIHELVKSLGVTRGSFYWHFKDREDFVRSIAEFYDRWSTDQVIEAIRSESHPKDRLRALMNYVFEHRMGRYEMAIHAWAFQEPSVAAALAISENNRLGFIRSVFRELGFEGSELETRVRAFVGYMNLDHSSFAREGDDERLRRLEERLDFFTRP
jgi:AcrR family transcriptional regulator